jgi:anti-sigma regulatory factor (Ser/Thr protein kinase)
MRRFERRFAPRPENAAVARELVRSALRESAIDPEDAVLLTDELVSNAIRHAETEFKVRVQVDDDVICVEVVNHAPELLLFATAPSSSGGRGLAIMSAVADEWGFARQSEDKCVWFRLFAPDR